MGSVRDALARLRQSYAPHEHRPLDGYLVTMSGHAAMTAGLAVLIKLTGKPVPERPALGDVVLLSIATHKLSRLLAKDAVTSPLRAPFTRYDGPIGSAEVAEQVRDEGDAVRHSVGELVSCPFCLAVWVATGLTGGLVLAPRVTRLVSTALTAVAVSDFLQLAYTIAKNATELSAPQTAHDSSTSEVGEPSSESGHPAAADGERAPVPASA